MRYGVCSWIFGDTPLLRIAELLSGLGYDGIELFGDGERFRHVQRKRFCPNMASLSSLSLRPMSNSLTRTARSERMRTITTCVSLTMLPSLDLL